MNTNREFKFPHFLVGIAVGAFSVLLLSPSLAFAVLSRAMILAHLRRGLRRILVALLALALCQVFRLELRYICRRSFSKNRNKRIHAGSLHLATNTEQLQLTKIQHRQCSIPFSHKTGFLG